MNNQYIKIASLLAAFLTGFTVTAHAQTLTKISAGNKITVSYRDSSIPFSYIPSPGSQPVGFAVDLTARIVTAIKNQLNIPNLEVAYIPVNGQNRIPLLVSGIYDLECGSTTNTAARGKEVTFAISHFYAGTRVLVKKSSKITDYAALDKKILVSTAGSTNEKVFRQYALDKKINFEMLSGKDYDDAFKMVESDRAAGLVLDDILLFGLSANSSTPSDYEIVGDTLQVEPYGCMMRKDDPDFKKLVDSTIEQLMESGEFTKLYSKWFEAPIPPKGIVLNMPMSQQLKNNLKARSDKPI
jgi:ABC-type amino acid transport substrate-binding protein